MTHAIHSPTPYMTRAPPLQTEGHSTDGQLANVLHKLFSVVHQNCIYKDQLCSSVAPAMRASSLSWKRCCSNQGLVRLLDLLGLSQLRAAAEWSVRGGCEAASLHRPWCVWLSTYGCGFANSFCMAHNANK